MTVFGTRPDTIKMAPVVKALRAAAPAIQTIVCVTAQHRQMLDDLLALFAIVPDYDLDIMRHDQSITQITTRVLEGMEPVLALVRPDVVLVHGDTGTSTAAALAAFYAKIPVGHVEAGLRTTTRWEPFPEEMNRRLTGAIASYHFAPTSRAREHLERENVAPADIIVTGNTVIDAFLETAKRPFERDPVQWARLDPMRPLIFVTAHRRENHERIGEICDALARIVALPQRPEILLPVHPSPRVAPIVRERLGHVGGVHLVEPMGYDATVRSIARSRIVITDSGGIQEEAPCLGKPVLVMRDETERPEGLETGTLRLVGPHEEAIVAATAELLGDAAAYARMAHASNPYGDGLAAGRIVDWLLARTRRRSGAGGVSAASASRHPLRDQGRQEPPDIAPELTTALVGTFPVVKVSMKLGLVFSVAGLFGALALSACGGGGGGSLPPAALGGVTTPSGGATTAPATGASASASPGASATPKPGASPTSPAPGSTTSGSATPTPTPLPIVSPTSVAVSSLPPPSAPPDAAGHTNVIPAPPAAGACRAGQIYSIYVTAPTGDTVAMTVFEPSTICGGTKYPLVLQAPGFGGNRTQTLDTTSAANPSQGSNVGNNLTELVDNGYGVISFDQRGMGETTGKIRVMDPDFEGKDYLSVMDWAQVKLGWIAYGPTLEGDDPSEPMMGSIGGSYGGMYQMLLLNIDKRHRLHAITPNITPGNLSYSLFQGSTPKTLWNFILFGDGQAAGNGTSRAQFDPYVNQLFVNDLAADQEDPFASDFFNYHSADYFCNGASVSTNGGAGTMPLLPPASQTPKVNAMVWIGVRDTLFNDNNGYENYSCLKRAGGDVRFLSYQAGHNSVGAVPDPGVTLYQPSGDANDSRCGSTLNEDAAQLAWMDQYLKGRSGAAGIVPAQPCVSLSAGDAVTVPALTVGKAGTEFDLAPGLTVVSGAQVDVPSYQVLYTAAADGIVEAGIPHVQLQVTTTAPVGAGTPIVYVGLGQTHANSSTPQNWDLIDNQVTPLRGTGTFDLDIIGGGTRLAKGDQLALLVYGLQDQYAATGSINVATPTVEPLGVTGKVWVPFLGPVSSI